MKVVKRLVFRETRENRSAEFHEVGVILQRDNGTYLMRLDLIPNFGERGRWIEIYDIKKKDEFLSENKKDDDLPWN